MSIPGKSPTRSSTPFWARVGHGAGGRALGLAGGGAGAARPQAPLGPSPPPVPERRLCLDVHVQLSPCRHVNRCEGPAGRPQGARQGTACWRPRAGRAEWRAHSPQRLAQNQSCVFRGSLAFQAGGDLGPGRPGGSVETPSGLGAPAPTRLRLLSSRPNARSA